MKTITEFTLADKKYTFEEALQNIPTGYRMPTKKELMLMYIMNDDQNLDLPKSNVWSDEEYKTKSGASTSAFAVLLTNGYTATCNKTLKFITRYVKK